MAQQRNNLLPHAYERNASQLTSSGARVAPFHLFPYQGYQLHPLHIPHTPRQASISHFQHQDQIPQNHAYVQPRQNRGYASIPTAYVQPQQNHSNVHPRQNPAYVQPRQNHGYIMVSELVWRMVDMLLQEADMNVSQGAWIPTALHALGSLPSSVVLPQHDEVAECAICMDDMCQEDQAKTITKLPCDHVFHRDCVVLWLSNHNICPLCRYKLPAEGITLEA